MSAANERFACSGGTWEKERKRNGFGVQNWPDGSRYEGEFVRGLKQGTGVFSWANGEFYKGSFYKDYRHGNGAYNWPDGSQFTGKFYLNRKEGYGVQLLNDGTVFQGLYHADECFGPGIVTYPDGRQDVGLWHRDRLLHLCTVLDGGFTLMDFPEHGIKLQNGRHFEKCQLQSGFTKSNGTCVKGSSNAYATSSLLYSCQQPVPTECFILPSDITLYSTDSDHLPIPQQLREELDRQYSGEHAYSHNAYPAGLTPQQRMLLHIQRHRFEEGGLNWDVASVLALNRESFGPKGPLELNSEQLIKEASRGNAKGVYRIVRDKRIHPDAGDARGTVALIAATVGCHSDVINMLLDNGADVNKLNAEGMSALAVCCVLFYPIQSIQMTAAEKVPRKESTKSQTYRSLPSSRGNPQETPTETVTDEELSHLPCPRTEDKQGEQTGSQPDANCEGVKSPQPIDNGNCGEAESPQPIDNGNCGEAESPQPLNDVNCEDAEPPQPVDIRSDGMDQPLEDGVEETAGLEVAEDTERKEMTSTQVLDGNFDMDSELLCEEDNDNLAEQVTDIELHAGRWSHVEQSFDSARSLASFHIHVTEDNMRETAELFCEAGLLPQANSLETIHMIAHKRTEHQKRQATMTLLLERGADPNASCVPMPVLFLAIKAGDVDSVRFLLECGARTNMPLSSEQKGLYPLHIAAGLPGPVGPQITELLLHALADPNVRAQDADEVFELDKTQNVAKPWINFGRVKASAASGPLALVSAVTCDPPEAGGRTPLHIACQRDSDYANVRDVVSLLLSHNAQTNVLWSGHSPLSLAIASGNDLAVDELLAGGADPNLPLARPVGNALCVAANMNYGLHRRNRTMLLDKLIKAGANILMPVAIGEVCRTVMGTVVDYAHYLFHQDWRIAHTPYHALNLREREVYGAYKQLLSLLGDLLRQAATSMEKQRTAKRAVYTGPGSPGLEGRLSLSEEDDDSEYIRQREERRPLFKYCYQCGRSVGVALTACSRCRKVFYCSKTCKMRAWKDRHKEECVCVPGREKS